MTTMPKLTHKQKQEYISLLELAAERILTGIRGFCCTAINLEPTPPQATGVMEALSAIYFQDSDAWNKNDVASLQAWWGSDEGVDSNEVRILALLLAAEMVRTDSLPE